MYHMELHNRHNSSIVRTTNLDFSREIIQNTRQNFGFDEVKSYTSENVFVDILAGDFIKFTVFPGGKIATIYCKEDNKNYFFPFATGSKNVFVSIINSWKETGGKFSGFDHGEA